MNRETFAADPFVATAPSDCTVVELRVDVGTEILAGTTLAVVEVMKIEQLVASAVDGVVASIDVGVGQVVARGEPLAVVTPGTVSVEAAAS